MENDSFACKAGTIVLVWDASSTEQWNYRVTLEQLMVQVRDQLISEYLYASQEVQKQKTLESFQTSLKPQNPTSTLM